MDYVLKRKSSFACTVWPQKRNVKMCSQRYGIWAFIMLIHKIIVFAHHFKSLGRNYMAKGFFFGPHQIMAIKNYGSCVCVQICVLRC